MGVVQADEERNKLRELVAEERRRRGVRGNRQREEGGAEEREVVGEHYAAAEERVVEGLEAPEVDLRVRGGGDAGEAQAEERRRRGLVAGAVAEGESLRADGRGRRGGGGRVGGQQDGLLEVVHGGAGGIWGEAETGKERGREAELGLIYEERRRGGREDLLRREPVLLPLFARMGGFAACFWVWLAGFIMGLRADFGFRAF